MMLRKLCRTLKRRMFRPPDLAAVLAVGRRYRASLDRAQRLMPGDPRWERLREEHDRAERAMLGRPE